MSLSIIVAVSENGVIGRDGGLPWHLADDLKLFKEFTIGHTLLMGRRTFDEVGKPLPGRTTILITRQADYCTPGVLIAHSLEEALEMAPGDEEVFVVGGSEIYAQTLPQATRLYLTLVRAEVQGDTRFPEFDLGEWTEISRREFAADSRNDFPFTFRLFERSRV
ncbi:MAG: dihydrofolate reductase [Acidobacteriota bacterium]